MSRLLEAVGLSKSFAGGVKAVDGVNLGVDRGETLGLVGESGCGKSTTAKLILRLLDADTGTIAFDGTDVRAARGKALRRLRAELQVVPQNPTTSLNPRLTISQSVEFNLRAQGVERRQFGSRVRQLLDQVGLSESLAGRYPHELSGGQLQRAAIARALSSEPRMVVCDEAVSALDKSVQAQVLNVLVDMQRELKVAYLFISHDLAVVEHVSDRVAVMYLGRVVEEAPAAEIWRHALHPYTQALLSAVPGQSRHRIVLRGDPPSPAHPPSGCPFRTRCAHAVEACARERPSLHEVSPGHAVACILHTPTKPVEGSSPTPVPVPA